MRHDGRHIITLTIALLGLVCVSSSTYAGSFRDFILAEEPATEQSYATIPTDSESAACMQCHNGSNAQGIGLKHAESAMVFTSHGSSNHPVGMSYSSYARKSPAAYVAPARLDSRIRLENGQVTCVSCHATKTHTTLVGQVAQSQLTNNPTCTSSKTLTTGPSQTQLCMSCHAM